MKIKVILKRPDEKIGHVTYIQDSLENLQRTVGGYLEMVRLDEKNILLMDEEARIKLSPVNFHHKMYGLIFGTVIVAGEKAGEVADTTLTRKEWQRMLWSWGNDTDERRRGC